MREPRETGNPVRRTAWIAAAGAAMIGAVTMLVRRNHMTQVRALLGARYDEESGRGRAATPASPRARKAGHETRDLKGGVLGKLVLLLGSVAACMVLAMIGLRIWVTHSERAADPAFTRLQTAIVTPPEPHLQRDPLREIANLHARENGLLDTYAYLQPNRTRARIPIDRAIALTIGQPLAPPP